MASEDSPRGQQHLSDDSAGAVDADVEDEVTERLSCSDGKKQKRKRKRVAKAEQVMSSSTSEQGDEETEPAGSDDGRCNGQLDPGESKDCPGESAESLARNVEDVSAKAADGQSIDSLMKMLNVHGRSAPKTKQEASQKSYQFWSTQPVTQMSDSVDKLSNDVIEADRPLEELRQVPLALPSGFAWDTLDISNQETLDELYHLLYENYVEDDDNMFRFDYSKEFLLWALKPPGWLRQWHCAVRVTKNRKLVGFISAIPATLKIYDKEKRLVEINFLCVHKKLRSKRLTPVLIKEITRRVNCEGIFQAVYTAGVVLPKPVATCRYWHRSLNPKKLIECQFSHLTKNMNMARTIRLYRLPEKTATAGFRLMRDSDAPAAHQLLLQYLKTFNLAPIFSLDEFRHWFSCRPGVVESFVVESETAVLNANELATTETASPTTTGPTTTGGGGKKKKKGKGRGGGASNAGGLGAGADQTVLAANNQPACDTTHRRITDFVSFYSLPSTVVNNPTHNTLKAAYSFYVVSTETPIVKLMQDSLITAKLHGYDVFNALDLMENSKFLEELKFGIGDGNLQYYLYNWRCAEMKPDQVGLVLL